MPVPILGLKVRSDTQKVEFLTISSRPKTEIFRRIRSVPGGPNAVDMDTLAARTMGIPQGNPWELFGGLCDRFETQFAITHVKPRAPPQV